MSDWIDVCAAEELMAGELRGLEIGRRLVLLANCGGVISAIDDFCNHAGCLLSGGWIDVKKGAVVCPCHEYAFDLRSGRNVTVPRLSEDQEAFPTKVVGGRVLLQIVATGVEDNNAR